MASVVERAVRKWIADRNDVILACSALRRWHRDTLREGVANPKSIRFVFLKGTYDEINRRLRLRVGHFMPETLLESQFATLEEPDASEALVVDVGQSVASVVDSIIAGLHLEPSTRLKSDHNCRKTKPNRTRTHIVTSAAITETRSIPHRRWGIALLLGFGVLVNYFDRVNLSVSQEALHNAFGISTVTFGYLLSAYSWTYAAFQLPSGLILDRFGVKLVGRIGTLLWSVASFAAAISTGLTGFLAARLLLGVGEAPTFPANAKAIGYWFPAQERSLATAIFDAAAKFASAIGVPALGLLLLRFGWRWSFAATGFLSLFYFVLFYKFYRSPSEDKSLSAVERDFIRQGGAQAEDRVRAARGAPLGYLLRQKKV